MVNIHKRHYNGPTTPRDAKARWYQCGRKNYDGGDCKEGKNEDRPVAFPDPRNFDPEIGSLHFLEKFVSKISGVCLDKGHTPSSLHPR